MDVAMYELLEDMGYIERDSYYCTSAPNANGMDNFCHIFSQGSKKSGRIHLETSENISIHFLLKGKY